MRMASVADNISNDEIQILREAASVATSVLPRLEKERAELDKRISYLRSVITAWEALTSETTESPSSIPHQSKRVPKGEVTRHIDVVLGDGKSYEEPDLRQIIAQRFGVEYTRSTSYAALRRGERDGKYERDGQMWRMRRSDSTADCH